MRLSKGAVLALVWVLLVAACGGGGPGAAGGAVAASSVKSAVEGSAKVTLAEESLDNAQFAEFKQRGATAVLSNQTTAATDRAVALVIVFDSADKVTGAKDEIDQMRSQFGATGRVISHKNLVVIYVPVGTDNGAAVESAVKAL
jgi:hypothetical protein